MRKTNNIDTLDTPDARRTGNIFWVVYDVDTGETLASVPDYDVLKWKRITLTPGDNWGLSELDESACWSSLEEAEQVAQYAADALAREYPEDDINLEIHRIRLEMVEIVNDVDCGAGKVTRRAAEAEDPEQLDREGWRVRDAEEAEDEEAEDEEAEDEEAEDEEAEDEEAEDEEAEDEKGYDFDWRRPLYQQPDGSFRMRRAAEPKFPEAKAANPKKDKKSSRRR